jgi:hypothetical protein
MKKIILSFILIGCFSLVALITVKDIHAASSRCVQNGGNCKSGCSSSEEELSIPNNECGVINSHCCKSFLGAGSTGGGWAGGGIDFNAIKVPGFNSQLTDIGSMVSALLPWIFGLAGIILLVMLIAGGFQLMMSAGDPKAAMSAKGKLTGALIGFLIIFCAYWITQIMENILGLSTGLF